MVSFHTQNLPCSCYAVVVKISHLWKVWECSINSWIIAMQRSDLALKRSSGKLYTKWYVIFGGTHSWYHIISSDRPVDWKIWLLAKMDKLHEGLSWAMVCTQGWSAVILPVQFWRVYLFWKHTKQKKYLCVAPYSLSSLVSDEAYRVCS